jgi:hypothetical protein
MIFRGDECVSFGWCFWHRACYGCLLCGSKVIFQGLRVPALYVDPAKPGGRGREVAEAPLCAVCVVEVEIDDLDEDAIFHRGLRRIDGVDGGVTRKRWELKSPKVRSMILITV